MKDKVHLYMCLLMALIKPTAGNETTRSPSAFHFSTSMRLTLAEAFRNDHVAGCSTAFRSATDDNQSDGYVTVPCPSKVTQHSGTTDWLKI